MITYMPSIYEDELCYSWFARYFAHSGYPSYAYALDDLFGKTIYFSPELINCKFQDDAQKVINDIIPMKKLVLDHTMFPQARFMKPSKRKRLFDCMVNQNGHNSGRLLPLPKSTTKYLRYCPLCAREQREKFGEAFWTRTANIGNLDICARHRCRLKDTNIIISAKESPRLHIAEQVIDNIEPEFVVDGPKLQFAFYLTNVFLSPINSDNDNNDIFVSNFLQSKLTRTKYLSVTGKEKDLNLLLCDFEKFYNNIYKGITIKSQMEQVFTGEHYRFYDVCQVAFFLGIDAEELINPMLPEKSQWELFNEEVISLKKKGYSAYRICQILDTYPLVVQNIIADMTTI